MICIDNIKKQKLNLSMKSKNLGLLALAMTLIALTSCGGSSKTNIKNLNIYQPSTLRLGKNNPVPTKDGIYTPQTDEVWHSDARYRRLEREVYYKGIFNKNSPLTGSHK